MRKARRLAGWGIGLALVVFFTPVLAMTTSPASPDIGKNLLFEALAGTPSLCPACSTSDTGLAETPPIATDRHLLLRLRSGAFDPLDDFRERSNTAQNDRAKPEKTLRMIQFPGSIQERWYQSMVDAGMKIVAYIPDYTYLVWCDENAVKAVRSGTPVRWSGLYQSHYALHPDLQTTRLSPEPVAVVVQLYNDPDTQRSSASILARAIEIIRPSVSILSYTNLSLKVAAADLTWITTQPGVVSVEPLLIPHMLDEVQGQIIAGHLIADGVRPDGPGYLAWLTGTVGFPSTPGLYPIIDITDDGIDNGSATPNHPDFYEFGDIGKNDRLIYNANWTTDPKADGAGGHGNLNASIAGGYNDRVGSAYEDSSGYNYGLGINPFARIAGSKIFGNTSGWANPVYTELVEYSHLQGARISSNSWGDDVGTGQYQTDDQIYDMLVRDAAMSTPGNQEITILFSAGNSGTGPGTIGSPGNAKNVITVGASESFRPTWLDGCGIGPTGADNANDIATFSSRGPTEDGRIKPEIVAPGTHILGAASQIPNYTGNYVCDTYYLPGQTLYLYAASSGTSHATPAVAGAVSLFYRYYKDHYSDSGVWPSPAMAKAGIINSAQYLDGVSSGDTLPSPNQGFGAVNLGTAFDGMPGLADDQIKVFQNSGESTTIRGYISDTNNPFRVTLAWTDAPGAVIGDAYVNNLNLIVNVGDHTYLGNVFSGATSISGGVADARNNVESVFLPAGLHGPFEITIIAENIAGDGVPGNGDATDQDYALICYNCARSDTFVLEVNPSQRTICAGDDAVYNISSTNYAVQPASISLMASGHPTTSTVAFSLNPIIAGGTSTMTVENTLHAEAGVYAIAVTGESITGTQVVTAHLQIKENVPESTTLVSPPESARDIALHPILNWMPSAQTELYAVGIATNTYFSPILYNAVTDKITHTVQMLLEPEIGYYWRITAQNICGKAIPSEPGHFTTRMAPLVVTSVPQLAIPDNDPTGITDTIRITDIGTLIDMDVAISITHSWVGDLFVSLEHLETGTVVALIDRPGVSDSYPNNPGCSGHNIDIYLDDSAPLAAEDNCQSTTQGYLPGAHYSPNEPLALFNDETWQGNWQLRVSDHFMSDTGILQQWSLIATLSNSPDNTIAFTQESYRVSKQVEAAVVTVTLQSTPASTITVEYITVPGSAIAGKDYLTTTGLLTFNHSMQQSFLVPILDNPENIFSRTLTLSLQNPANAELVVPNSAPLYILADKQTYNFYLQLIMKRYPAQP